MAAFYRQWKRQAKVEQSFTRTWTIFAAQLLQKWVTGRRQAKITWALLKILTYRPKGEDGMESPATIEISVKDDLDSAVDEQIASEMQQIAEMIHTTQRRGMDFKLIQVLEVMDGEEEGLDAQTEMSWTIHVAVRIEVTTLGEVVVKTALAGAGETEETEKVQAALDAHVEVKDAKETPLRWWFPQTKFAS